ncbi:heavy metal-associated isoprenylated plant protein 6-like isoform X3 [Mangifera indica]|uniref:heavy metal-associated isoprenylated plant protein 6-like isoform X3 n=1 Tax=Mangifera indica TaxID=29780 RepID=UPI001CFAE716|nr:heavy metal-associated isoprenylated plant protein 6-like isoform X3 [Mangifera indica]
MEEKKVAIMVLKVDLQCEKCYRKAKRVLCKFPQIQDQVYDVKQNTVTIKVVCCSPEKIEQKICCKGGESIKSIEIVPPPKRAKEPEKPKELEKPKGLKNPICYDGYYGRPVYDSWGGGSGEENPNAA